MIKKIKMKLTLTIPAIKIIKNRRGNYQQTAYQTNKLSPEIIDSSCIPRS